MNTAAVVTVAVGTLVAAAAAAAVVAVRRGWVAVTVVGDSMSPAFRDGDRVLVRRRPPVRGDAVVVEAPASIRFAGRWNLKRVAALAGDPVPESVRGAAGVGVVPRGSVVVLGDNPVSFDSRQAGLYPADRVLGVAVRRLPGRPNQGRPNQGRPDQGRPDHQSRSVHRSPAAG